MKQIKYKRILYFSLFAILTGIEVLIALFVHDNVIRPYDGDIIVVAVILCFVRIFIPDNIKFLPVYVFVFAVLVEIAQYFDIVNVLGLGHIEFFRIIIGTSFAWLDILCYGIGAVICLCAEKLFKRCS